jgi:hypothetical protein
MNSLRNLRRHLFNLVRKTKKNALAVTMTLSKSIEFSIL